MIFEIKKQAKHIHRGIPNHPHNIKNVGHYHLKELLYKHDIIIIMIMIKNIE